MNGRIFGFLKRLPPSLSLISKYSSPSSIRYALRKNPISESSQGGVYSPSSPSKTKIQKVLEFFQSEKGKKFSSYGAGFLSLFTIICKGSPHTWAQEYVQMFYQCYASPLKVSPVPPAFSRLIESAISDLEVPIEQASRLKIFVGKVDDVSSWGTSAGSSYGALIAYPQFLNIFEVEAIPDVYSLSLGSKPGDDKVATEKSRGKDAENLKASLMISEKAKKFAIARELVRVSENRFMESCFISGGFVMGTVFISKILNILGKNTFLKASILARFAMYSAIGSVSWILHRRLQDKRANDWDVKCDSVAAKINPDYIEGAKEYYDKILLRHKSLRELIPNNRGRQIYNLKGDFVPKLFGSRISLSKKRKLLDEI